MVSFLKNLQAKFWVGVVVVLGLLFGFWQKEKLEQSEAENELAKTKEKDAGLAAQQQDVEQAIATQQVAAKAQEAQPAPTGDELAKDLNKV